jgi:DHA2 family multidrug resistance protein-like MFS transporter
VTEPARQTIAGASAAAQGLPAGVAHQVVDASREAFVTAMHTTSAVAVAILVFTSVLTLVLLRGRPAPVAAEVEPQAEPALAGAGR